MILTKRFWIVLITIALLGILALVFKNKITIKPQDNILIDASSAEIYGEHKYANGESLYHRYCYSCHGELETDEKGSDNAPPLNQFGNVWKLSSNNIAKKILFSSLIQKDSKMPSFAGMLKEDQVKDIITYIIYGLPKPYIKERQRILKITLPTDLDTIHATDDYSQTIPTDQNPSTTTDSKQDSSKANTTPKNPASKAVSSKAVASKPTSNKTDSTKDNATTGDSPKEDSSKNTSNKNTSNKNSKESPKDSVQYLIK